jgi:hypothetical protein
VKAMDKKTIEDLFWTGEVSGYCTATGAFLLADGVRTANVLSCIAGTVFNILGMAEGYRYRRLKKKLLGEEQ